MERIFW